MCDNVINLYNVGCLPTIFWYTAAIFKIKLVDQFRSASVCDIVINLHNVVSRLQ